MASTLTGMQQVARAWADMPRALVAKRLGLKTPQALSMRLKRATDRERRGKPRARATERFINVPAVTLEHLAHYRTN